MQRGFTVGVLTVVLLAGVAAAGTAPHVDAGLDQEVYEGDQVFLDGSGTWDDDGDITHKEWSIETPTGDTIQPACPTCWVTTFQANLTGEYAVTLTVEDSEGHERSDTLYVTVEAFESDDGDDDDSSDGGNWEDAPACWGRGPAIEGPGVLHPDWCDAHGDAVGFIMSDAGGIEYVVFENDGLADDYSVHTVNPDGTVTVPVQVFKDEAADLWDGYQSGSEGDDEFGDDDSDDGCLAPCGAGS